MNLHFKPYANPILILNDTPDGLGGLSRIGRDLASLLCTMPEFRVGYLGRGGVGRAKFPWTQYSYPETAQWGESHIADVWNDFAGMDDGIIMSLWDASRMLWFSQTNGLPPAMQKFLGPGRNFLKWGYFPVDGYGPSGPGYGVEMASAVEGYDRLLAASQWGSKVLHESGRHDAGWIPHGIWTDKFKPLADPFGANKRWLGCNMANQARKDWPVAFKCARILSELYGNAFHFWCNTDRAHHYWNLSALAVDFGIAHCTNITSNLTDLELAQHYSICDATILPSAGEGFGFPIAESMACGTPCVVTDYAAGQEIVDQNCRVPPVAFRVDTQYNLQRAVLDGHTFAGTARLAMDRKHNDPVGTTEAMVKRVEHLDWNKLAPVWKKWFLNGLNNA